MGSDPGSELPNVQDSSSIDNSATKRPNEYKCSICGLTARNNEELSDHINHAHNQKDSNHKNNVYSEEQKIDPFIKTGK